jgi:hypothetical protein
MKRAVEFFEGVGNRLSMMRLMLFMSWFPASWVLFKNGTTEALAVYVGTYAALSGNNKWAERKVSNGVDSEQLEDINIQSSSVVTSSSVVASKPVAGQSVRTGRGEKRTS